MAHYNRGHCLAQLHRPADAIVEFQAAISIQPAFAAAHSSLGEVLARSGQTEAAREHLRRAVELNAHDAVAKQLLDRLPR